MMAPLPAWPRARTEHLTEAFSMTHVVTESCIRCKYTDCVDVCPVDCFHEGPNFLVIDPEECIDCTLCVAECPVEAIYAEDDVPASQEHFKALNAELAKKWKTIIERKPAPPDEIQGFITRGKGVSIHRMDCSNFANLLAQHPERVIETAWGGQTTGVFAADIVVDAHDRQGLLRDIEIFTGGEEQSDDIAVLTVGRTA